MRADGLRPPKAVQLALAALPAKCFRVAKVGQNRRRRRERKLGPHLNVGLFTIKVVLDQTTDATPLVTTERSVAKV